MVDGKYERAQTKGDRNDNGTTFKAPALARFCSVDAYLGWIGAAQLVDGPVFRGVDRWGYIPDSWLHVNSLVPIMRSLFEAAGIDYADQYRSHSLRRGFANWATSNSWNLKTLMEYVGCTDAKSAMRYIDAVDPFATKHAIQIEEFDSVIGESRMYFGDPGYQVMKVNCQ